MVMNPTIFIGTDIEWFFRKNGRPFSAHNVLPPKENAMIVSKDFSGASEFTKRNCPGSIMFHWDGVQAEMTIAEAWCRAYLMERVRKALRRVLSIAEEHKLDVDLNSSLSLSKRELNALPDEIKRFGCDADLVAWLDGLENPLILDPNTHINRYAGLHVHLGNIINGDLFYDDEDTNVSCLKSLEGKINIVKVLDIILGSPMVMFDRYAASTLRRQVYGKAGVFRDTPYGLEYRVLSSTLLKSPILLNLVFSMARHAVGIVHRGEHEELFELIDPKIVILSINRNDPDLALENWLSIKDFLLRSLRNVAGEELGRDAGFKLFEYVAQRGIESVFPRSFIDYWFLNKNSNLDGHQYWTTWHKSRPDVSYVDEKQEIVLLNLEDFKSFNGL